MKTTNLIAAGVIGAGLTFGALAQAAHEETQVEMKDVPQAAQTTIKEKAGNATRNPDLRDRGTMEKAGGKMQRKIGDVKKVFDQ